MRRSEFVSNVNNLIRNDHNSENYKSKITLFIQNGNINYLTKELIWQPNIVLSMIDNATQPFLCLNATMTKNLKLFEMFLGALFHFGNNIVGKDYIKKYLNFNQCHGHIIKDKHFVKSI